MIRFAIFYLSLFAFNITCAQTNTGQIELKGVLVDEKDRTPLSYVNIGVLNKSLITISNTTGRFSLNLKEENLTDKLQISRIGYHTIKVFVN
ncbi:carboxypeptidase-like regulatory domain-containing protein [Dyadobacter sp. CY345]|uniref:carboxypeptidase-like regulatory domain-containing protein n=1 Tax=Dyadobacter sp. CY345 TaxID=2909335 RepID=UPI001F1CB046|nr:carboxypeptidase-like regulatory domain-containing protein [Dyadobacter sp. CY345]MCF2447401.1 carboxypeptidase-like regulatory domain-containing protein [Dyadobacter sp. CY345]